MDPPAAPAAWWPRPMAADQPPRGGHHPAGGARAGRRRRRRARRGTRRRAAACRGDARRHRSRRLRRPGRPHGARHEQGPAGAPRRARARRGDDGRGQDRGDRRDGPGRVPDRAGAPGARAGRPAGGGVDRRLRQPRQPVRPATWTRAQGGAAAVAVHHVRRACRRARRRGRRAGRRPAARGPGGAFDARRRGSERRGRAARGRARRRGSRTGPDGRSRRRRRPDAGEREGQLHQGHRGDTGAAGARHGRTPAALTLRPSAGAAAGIAGSAALVAALTLAARVAGFGRVFVFSASVGAGCTGTAYAAANQIPNVLFEVVAGGALAGAVVPVIAAALTRGGRVDADRAASALLTWTVLGLLPVALLLGAFARPVTGLFLHGSDCAGAVTLATRMLVVFAPQVVLYGVGIVLTGVLQAHHRFAGPALAPLLSSVVVIAAYAWYARLAGSRHATAGFVPNTAAELALSLGTTVGVAALSLPLLAPARRVGGRLRPALRFPAGTAALVGSLAGAGVAALLAQQAAVVVVLALATRTGGEGALNVYQYAQAVYLLPYAVLAVPVATAAFPRLSRQAADGDGPGFAATNAATTRAVIVAALVGASALAAVAPAVQSLFAHLDAVGGPVFGALGPAVTVFAIGLPGWALVAHLSRSLYA